MSPLALKPNGLFCGRNKRTEHPRQRMPRRAYSGTSASDNPPRATPPLIAAPASPSAEPEHPEARKWCAQAKPEPPFKRAQHLHRARATLQLTRIKSLKDTQPNTQIPSQNKSSQRKSGSRETSGREKRRGSQAAQQTVALFIASADRTRHSRSQEREPAQ